MKNITIFIIGALLGAMVGAALIFYLFVGAPRAAKPPAALIQSPDPNGNPATTATVILRQDFFNEVLKTIFRDMNPPAFPLAFNGENKSANDGGATRFGLQAADGGCESKISLKQEGSNGVITGVSFQNGQITAPLAFAGSYNVPFLGCQNFTGWAEANLKLEYDAQEQAVKGRIEIQTVNPDGLPPVVSGLITQPIQNTLNERVNPIPILRGEQIALKLPITSTAGTLNANVKDIRAEVKDNALNLYVIYDFTGTKNQ